MNQDPILQKAIDKWERMSQDASFRKEYEAREKVLMDEAAGIAHALNKGREQGIEQGKMQLIQGMHKNGISVQNIAKMTGLTEVEIQRFLQR